MLSHLGLIQLVHFYSWSYFAVIKGRVLDDSATETWIYLLPFLQQQHCKRFGRKV